MSCLPSSRDPLGAALTDYCQTGKTGYITTWSSLEGYDKLPVKRLLRTYRDMPEQERIALQACRGKVLDAGAGAGSHALYLQEKGLEVEAIDISPGACEYMKKRGLASVHCMEFLQVNTSFDTILMMMNGIGIAGDMDGLETLLAHCHNILHPGGRLLADSADLIYYFDDDSPVEMDRHAYYGELEYRMSYKSIQGDRFKWLFIDYFTLEVMASAFGFKADPLWRGQHFEYLAGLTKR